MVIESDVFVQQPLLTWFFKNSVSVKVLDLYNMNIV